MRMSLARARARPPPAAGPFTAAITGWGSERNRGTSAAIWVWVAKVAPTRSSVLGARRVAVPCEVDPGAEAPSGACEDDHPAGAVDGDARQRLVKLGDQCRVHGVQPLGAVQGDPGDALVRLVDLQCVHDGSLLLGSAISCNTRHGGAAARRRAGTGAATWACTIRASSTLRRPRSSPGTSGRGRCCASLPPWQPIKVAQESHSLADGRAVLRLPGGRALGCATFGRRPAAPIRGRAGVAPAALAPHALVRGGRRWGDQGDRRRRDARARFVPPADLPLPASPARRGPGGAPQRGAAGRALLTIAVTGSSGLDRLRPVRLPLDRRAPRHPPGAEGAP